MKISPVASYSFGKTYSKKEIEQLRNEAQNARSRYCTLEDKTFFSVEGGMDAWFRAKDAGFEYADKSKEGERYREAWENYSKAHIHPLRKGEAEAKEEYKAARKAYYEKASIGKSIYFLEHEDDNAIRQEVVQKMAASEEGEKIINNYAAAQARYHIALRDRANK